MDKYWTEHFKRKLDNEKEHFDKVILGMKQNGVSEQGERNETELSNYDNHPAELGTQLFDVEQNNALMVNVQDRLYQINEALQRIEDGKYGVCTYCGKEIGRERLDAIPYTSLCIDCEESKSDDTMLMSRKMPYEEEKLQLTSNYNYMGNDNEFEGLDQWYDLAKYGSSDSPQDMGPTRQYYEDYYTNDTDKQGIVDDMDQVSNEEYKKQLPD
jgi:YteA family regulatory protein